MRILAAALCICVLAGPAQAGKADSDWNGGWKDSLDSTENGTKQEAQSLEKSTHERRQNNMRSTNTDKLEGRIEPGKDWRDGSGATNKD